MGQKCRVGRETRTHVFLSWPNAEDRGGTCLITPLPYILTVFFILIQEKLIKYLKALCVCVLFLSGDNSEYIPK